MPSLGDTFHRWRKGLMGLRVAVERATWGGSSVAPSLLLLIPETFAHPGVDLVAMALDLMCIKDLRRGVAGGACEEQTNHNMSQRAPGTCPSLPAQYKDGLQGFRNAGEIVNLRCFAA